MKIDEFLEILEARQLVSDRVVRKVRDKIAKGDRKITAKSLLKYLVKKELITRSQAKQLLETTLTVTPAAESSILGMVALPEQVQREIEERNFRDSLRALRALSGTGIDQWLRQ